MDKARKRRADSYLGIHFGFHAKNTSPAIGANTTIEMVEKVIEAVKPDYIQTDCKGHACFSSYPTKVGNQAPGLVTDRDTLKIWREATEKHGVALYVHYSGIWDREAVRRHPEWAITAATGERDIVPDTDPTLPFDWRTFEKGYTSVFGSYSDELMAPRSTSGVEARAPLYMLLSV